MFISLTVIGSSFIPLQSLIINENYYHFIARLAAIASLKALQSLPLSFIIYFKFIFNFSRARDPFASVVTFFPHAFNPWWRARKRDPCVHGNEMKSRLRLCGGGGGCITDSNFKAIIFTVEWLQEN